MAGPAVVVAAHPDDETIGLGGQLACLGEPYVIHLTDGAPRGTPGREQYAEQRATELREALRIAAARACVIAPCPIDQELSFEMVRVTEELARWLDQIRPRIVYTHPYEGGHPDHDAAALIVRAACPDGIAIREFTSYHNWTPEGPRCTFSAGRFLPDPGMREETVVLTLEQRAMKRRMFECFRSQHNMLTRFPICVERTREAPRYDFTRPPHPGRLYYEGRGWGVTPGKWRELAASALLAAGHRK